MKWITLAEIKANSRIDFDYDDDLVTRCGNAAELYILKQTRRTYENIEDVYGNDIDDLKTAALLLADVGYKHRSPVSDTNKSVVPYTFDNMIADYVRTTKATALQCERDDLLNILGSMDTDLSFDFSELENPTAEQTTEYNAIKAEIVSVMKRFTQFTNPTSNICKILRQKVNSIKQQIHDLFNPNNND